MAEIHHLFYPKDPSETSTATSILAKFLHSTLFSSEKEQINEHCSKIVKELSEALGDIISRSDQAIA